MNILADASLPGLNAAFPEPFKMLKYSDTKQIPELLAGQDILLCRSTLKVNRQLLANHQLRFVATASSGTDHLDHDYLKSAQITVIDAKGSNATSVADYVVATLAYLHTQNSNVKSAGIIGMGKVGQQVFLRLRALGLDIQCYDPLKALKDRSFVSCSKEELYQCDLLCVHAELHDEAPYPSRNLVDEQFLSCIKQGCIIINAARGGIIDETALLKHQSSLLYCTDVYNNEPAINQRIVDRATVCTPHIAGHSLEAKFLAVAQVSEQLHRLAGLTLPSYATPECLISPNWSNNLSWQERVLSIYNPMHETMLLQRAVALEQTFLAVRKAHLRHDFSLYQPFINDKTLNPVFGI